MMCFVGGAQLVAESDSRGGAYHFFQSTLDESTATEASMAAFNERIYRLSDQNLDKNGWPI